MEEIIENLASKCYKSKLELRSGIWKICLSDRAQDLTAFTIPNGRCFHWKCMPFGLQGAPGVFQEMMEYMCAKAKQKLQELGVNSRDIFLSAFFDDYYTFPPSPEPHDPWGGSG